MHLFIFLNYNIIKKLIFYEIIFNIQILSSDVFKTLFSILSIFFFNVLDYLKSELEKPPSLDDVSSDSVFGSSASPPEHRQNYMGLLRHRALRSFSDIERSPSKSETDEIQAILRELKRCISDPTFTPPSQKAMLREERLAHGFFPPNDWSEEESPPDSFDHVTDQARINADLRRMNSIMRNQLDAMKKQQAKRQLFSPNSRVSSSSEGKYQNMTNNNLFFSGQWSQL